MRLGRRVLLTGMLGAALLWGVARSAAELADVYLKNGLVLRGEVSANEDEVVVRNAAGEMRVPRADVQRIVPVVTSTQRANESATMPAATGPAPEPPAQPQTQPEPAQDTPEPGTLPARAGPPQAAPPTQPAATQPELPAAPLLSEADIQRLKLLELRREGAAERVRVRFRKKARERDLPLEVLDELRRRPDYQRTFGDILERGQPYEKLQLIVRETQAKYVDRIIIDSDPGIFADFRRTVLPLVNRSCGRSGCHAGRTARLFRLPAPGQTEAYAYTVFALLDQMETRYGPLINRSNPEESVLLGYFLPIEKNPRAHPPTRSPNFEPVARTLDDRQYQNVLSWINELTLPHPDYKLEYRNPYPGLLTSPTAPATAPATRPAEAPPTPPPVR